MLEGKKPSLSDFVNPNAQVIKDLVIVPVRSDPEFGTDDPNPTD